jgi:NAD(P)-dependent dehydrogenase (short-subunit alcohol dehydrogenase family)
MAGRGVAVVTGAGSGIGLASARALREAGWRVALLGRRAEALREAAAGRDGTLVLPCDVTDEAQVEAAFGRAAAEWGRIDFVFNNAGQGSPSATPDETAVADWRRVIEVNLTGSFLVARAAFARMRTQVPQGGRIVNNGSISAQAPRPGSAPYTASKHAITGLTKSLILDGRPFDIAAGQIDVGNALTDMARPLTVGARQADGSVRPEPAIDPAVVADMVVHMAGLPLSANVSFVTVMATAMPLYGRG